MAAAGKRIDARGEATRIALIEAAESLFAESGMDGVSTRRIGSAIGSSNTNVVAYHFGGKDALVREIYRYRLPDIEKRRAALLDACDGANDAPELRDLLQVFFQPLFEQVDAEGRHSYARFLAGLERSGMIATRTGVHEEFPRTAALFERLKAAMPADARDLFPVRMRLVTGLVASALHQIDMEASDEPATAQRMFDNAIAMAAAAMASPGPGA